MPSFVRSPTLRAIEGIFILNRYVMNYVYILSANGYFKIGVTTNINKRIKALQTGCPFKIELVALLKTDEHYKIESELHIGLEPYQTYGEWFLLDKETFNSIILDYYFELMNESIVFRDDKESILEFNLKLSKQKNDKLNVDNISLKNRLEFEYQRALDIMNEEIKSSKNKGFELAIEILKYYKDLQNF